METVYSHYDQVLCPLVVTGFKSVYFYRHWLGWVEYLVFERRMWHRLVVQADSFFAGLHNMKLFCVPGRHLIHIYHLLSTWWSHTATCTRVYPIPSL